MKIELWPIDSDQALPEQPARTTTRPSTPWPPVIQEFGFRQPIVVDEDGVIIVGHTRYKAAHEARAGEGPGPRRRRT